MTSFWREALDELLNLDAAEGIKKKRKHPFSASHIPAKKLRPMVFSTRKKNYSSPKIKFGVGGTSFQESEPHFMYMGGAGQQNQYAFVKNRMKNTSKKKEKTTRPTNPEFQASLQGGLRPPKNTSQTLVRNMPSALASFNRKRDKFILYLAKLQTELSELELPVKRAPEKERLVLEGRARRELGGASIGSGRSKDSSSQGPRAGRAGGKRTRKSKESEARKGPRAREERKDKEASSEKTFPGWENASQETERGKKQEETIEENKVIEHFQGIEETSEEEDEEENVSAEELNIPINIHP